jgi:hypothetical protein
MRRRALIILSCLLALVASPALAVAQLGASTPAPPPEVDVPSPGECWVPPVSLLSVLAMLNKVEAAQWDRPIGSLSLAGLDRGDAPLSAEDAEGIDATNRQLIACANAVSPLQVVALLSERFQARLIVAVMEEDDMDAVAKHLPMLATQTAESEGIAALEVTDAWYLPGTNKAISAVVTPYVSDPERQVSFLVTYAYSIDHWVIDDVQLIDG